MSEEGGDVDGRSENHVVDDVQQNDKLNDPSPQNSEDLNKDNVLSKDNVMSSDNLTSYDTQDQLMQMVVDLKFQNEYLKSHFQDLKNVHTDSSAKALEQNGTCEDLKELHEKLEALNRELVIERQTRGAAEAALEHLRAEYTEADSKSQELAAKLAEAEKNLDQQVKERDEKNCELDPKLNGLHKRAKQRIQEVQKEKDDLEAKYREVNEKSEQASLQLSGLQPQQPFTQPQSSSQPIEASSSRQQKKQKKKKAENEMSSRINWSEQESLALAKAWVHVSEDPYVSTNQDKDTFWYKIMELFKAEWPHTNRTKDSLTGKWDYIRTKVNKFNGIYSQLIQSNGARASGTSDAGVLTAAFAEYRVVVGSDFPHIQCWEFLKDKQKFLNPDPCVIGRRNKKRDAGETRETPFNLDDDDEGVNVADTFHSREDTTPRPPGRPGKSQRTTSSSATGSGNTSSSSFFEGINNQVTNFNIRASEVLADKMAATLEITRVHRFKQRNLDMELLRTDTSAYPEEAREMIEQQKTRIMRNLTTGYYDI